jgi:hypothetical protein
MPAGSTATLSNASAVSPFFTPDLGGSYVLELSVFDGSATTVDAVLITVTAPNNVPVANAGPDQLGDPGDTIQLDGTGSSDPDGDTLFYSWSFVSVPTGSAAALSDPNAPDPTFVIDLAGDYEVQLIVNDGTDDSAPDTMTVRQWSVEVVDSADDVGLSASLVLDSSDNPHIAYFDTTSDRVLYAVGSPTTWTVTEVSPAGTGAGDCSIALDSAETPHIAYHWFDGSRGHLSYASFDGASWSSEVAITNTAIRFNAELVMSSADAPRVAYLHPWPFLGLNLSYLATRDASGWSEFLVTSTDRNAADIALVLDADDQYHTAVSDIDSRLIYYTTQDNTTGDRRDYRVATGTDPGTVDLTIDDAEVAYFVWVEQTTANLMFTYYDGTTHTPITLDPVTLVDGSVSIVIDSAGVLHIAYYDVTNGDLKYATGTVAGGFTYEVVDSNADVGVDNDIVLDASGKPHIAYYDATTGDLKYAHK